MQKFKNLGIIFFTVLFFSTLSLATTTQQSVAGLEKFVSYLAAFLIFVKWVGYATASIYLIFKLIEFVFNPQWDQIGKTILTFILIIAVIFGIATIVNALGGTVVQKNVERISYEKLQFLGEENERK